MFLSLKGSLNTKFPRFKGILDTYAGASAAYSLRRLSRVASSVVRVRRASDNSEKDFSATDVSSGAMTDWVNTDVLTYESDFSSGTDGFVTTASPSLDGNIDSIGGRNDNLRLTSNAPLVTVNTYFRRNSILSVGNSYRVTFDAYIPSTNSVLDDFDTVAFGTSQVNVAGQITLDQWTSYDVTGTANNTALFIRLKGNSSGDATGDVVYIRNVQITQTTAHGFVETWYDQSGNGNDAVQATAGSQPKVVDGGSLITRGANSEPSILFGGAADNRLDVVGRPIAKSVFSALQASNTNFETLICDTTDNAPRATTNNNANNRAYKFEGFGTPSVNVDGVTYNGTSNVSSLGFHLLGMTSGSGSSINRIGANPSAGSTGNSFNYVSELILYPSDQSANRAAIENNINNQYDIY